MHDLHLVSLPFIVILASSCFSAMIDTYTPLYKFIIFKLFLYQIIVDRKGILVDTIFYRPTMQLINNTLLYIASLLNSAFMTHLRI